MQVSQQTVKDTSGHSLSNVTSAAKLSQAHKRQLISHQFIRIVKIFIAMLYSHVWVDTNNDLFVRSQKEQH